MTLMIKPDINPNNASMLTLVAALAVAKAITSVTGEKAMIKWPKRHCGKRQKGVRHTHRDECAV